MKGLRRRVLTFLLLVMLTVRLVQVAVQPRHATLAGFAIAVLDVVLALVGG
jgi:hypothetical protein